MVKPFLKALLCILLSSGAAIAQEELPKGYDVLSYEAVIALDRDETTIRGHAKMNAVVTTGAPIRKVLQHLIYLTIDSVKINGFSSQIEVVDESEGSYRVIVPEEAMVPGFFTVETWYHGNPVPEDNNFKWGGVSNRGGMMFAMGVGFQAPYISCTRHWLPCYDLPDDKADSARLTFLSPSDDIIVSSGSLDRVYDTLGMKAFEWNIKHPIASYLMTFAMGPYKHIEVENDISDIHAYALANDSARTARLMQANVLRGLRYFDSLFMPYPFEKVGYVITPIGSMEHQTMISLVRGALDTNSTTSVHELAHMWWGDLVTCQTFNDPWLNEGFATFSESLYLERFKGKQAYRKQQWSNIQSAMAKGSDYPMYGAPYHNNHANNYPTAVLYDKGAAVVGMLRYHLGDERFFPALRSYLTKFAYSTATSFDLWKHMEESSGEDLDWFFQKWVFEKGYPEFDVRWTESMPSKITLEQTSTSGFFKLPIVVEATAANNTKARRTIWADSAASTTLNVDFGFVPVSIQLDPDSVLIAEFDVEIAELSSPREYKPISITPNPTKDKITISNLPLIDGTDWKVVDSSGRVLRGGGAYSETETISLAGLPAGVYTIVVEIEYHVATSQQVVYQP
jgi:aminopeptidase N